MSVWTDKRFWTAATAEPCDGGFTVRLDGRPVKTPARALLVVPTHALAAVLAAEWDAQQGKVCPETMPVTRMANSALDKVRPQFHEVATLLSSYGGTDLICYRATGPGALVARHRAAWDPLLDWAATTLRAPLVVTQGVIPVSQDPASLARLHTRVAGLSPFHLAAFHDLVSITGSLILPLAITMGRVTGEDAWHLSRIDEAWQSEQWGEDDDAAAHEAMRKAALLQAERFYGLCG